MLVYLRDGSAQTVGYIRTEAGWSLGSFLPAILWYAY